MSRDAIQDRLDALERRLGALEAMVHRMLDEPARVRVGMPPPLPERARVDASEAGSAGLTELPDTPRAVSESRAREQTDQPAVARTLHASEAAGDQHEPRPAVTAATASPHPAAVSSAHSTVPRAVSTPAVAAASVPAAMPAQNPAAVLPYTPSTAPEAPVREGAWEQTIGLKVAGWVGALVLVIGAALGIKFGYEHWVVRLPAEVRLATLAAFGFGLIAAGEWVYRRVHVLSAVGLFGAGVASLFLVAYTGHGYFDLYSRDVAFVLMALATLIGAAVAMRGRLVSIATLSILGGHVAPLVLGDGAERLVEFLAYLLMLQVVALVLAAWGNAPRWWTLRWLALLTTAAWLMPMLEATGRGHLQPAAPLGFTILYAVLFLLELSITSLRQAPASGDRVHAESPATSPKTVPGLRSGQLVWFSFWVTAGLVAATLLALRQSEPMVRGAWVIAYALLETMLAAGLILRRRTAGVDRSDAQRLSIALRIQAAGLVVLAVPVALAGPAVTIAWGVLALAFAAVARRLDLPISRLAAVATWILAVLYIPWALNTPNEARNEAMGRILFAVMGAEVPVFVVLSGLMTLIGQVIAWLISAGGAPATGSEPIAARDATDVVSETADLERSGVVLSLMASAVGVLSAMAGLSPIAAALGGLLYAWVIALADGAVPRLRLAGQALLAIVVITCKWLMVDVIAERLSTGWTAAQLAYSPLANPLMGMGVLLAGSMAGICWLRRHSLRRLMPAGGSGAALALGTLLIVLGGAGLTLEIDRVISAARAAGWSSAWDSGQVLMLCWTILWSILTAALAMLAWFTTDDPARRHRRLKVLAVLPLLLLAKHVIFDTLVFRLMWWRSPGMALANPEALASVCVLGTLAGGWWLLRRHDRRSIAAGLLGFCAMLLVLFTGTLEISRLCTQLAGPGTLARQVAWSIWWSSFAVISVSGGFIWRLATMRYFGLGLFAVTIIKVFLIDLHGVSGGWRTISFIGLGLLLIGTSVLYGKFSPRLLAANRA